MPWFDVLAAPYFAAALVLALAGASKLRRPGPPSRALRAAGMPSARWLVRCLAVVELAVAVGALAFPRTLAAVALGTVYLGFAAFLGRMLVRGTPQATCGCLGERDLPPSALHVALNLTAAGAAIGVAATGGPAAGATAFVTGLPLDGAPFLVGAGLLAFLAYLAAAYLPEAFAAFREIR